MDVKNIFDNGGLGQLYIGPCCYNVRITEVTQCRDSYSEFNGYIFDSLNPHGETTVKHRSMDIEKVIFNRPATIIKWKDGTKTVVKCQDGDVYDAEKGLALCIAKKALGNKGNFNEVFKKYIPEDDTVSLSDALKTVWDNVHDFVRANPILYKKEYYNGRIVFTEIDENRVSYGCLTVGKIYIIKDGKIIVDNGDTYPMFRGPFMTVSDMREFFKPHKFIEIKE